jgi:hypothetical protein
MDRRAARRLPRDGGPIYLVSAGALAERILGRTPLPSQMPTLLGPGAFGDDDDEDRKRKRVGELPYSNMSPKFVSYAQKGRLDSTSSVAAATSASAESTAPAMAPPSPPADPASAQAPPARPPAPPAPPSEAIIPSSAAAGPAASSSAADRQPTAVSAPGEPPPVAPSPPRPVPPSRPKQAPPSPSSVAPVPALPVDENGPKVVPRIVATWKAPADGGVAGRLYKYDELALLDSLRRRVGHGKFRAGKRKRDLRDQVPSKSSREAYIKASREGKSCCANAVWFD